MQKVMAKRWEAIPKAITTALIVAVFLAYVAFSAPFDSDIRAQDVEAYWTAAEILRNGGDLYGERVGPWPYSPWFAYLWVPLTYLPRGLVEGVWLIVLLGCVVWLAYPLLSSFTGLLAALFIVPQVTEYAWIGNVDALMLAALALLHTRAGPVLVGLAASLKISPIAFVAYYLLRREWGKAALSSGVAVALWMPAFLFDMSAFGESGYGGVTPWSLMNYGLMPWLLGNGLIIATIGIIGLRDRRFVLLACAVAAMLGNPRLNLYSVGYLLVPARIASRPGNDGGPMQVSSPASAR